MVLSTVDLGLFPQGIFKFCLLICFRKRLGKVNSFYYVKDLRSKLNQTIKTKDARAIIRNRVRQRNNTFQDARSLIRGGKQKAIKCDFKVPFILPVRTVSLRILFYD